MVADGIYTRIQKQLNALNQVEGSLDISSVLSESRPDREDGSTTAVLGETHIDATSDQGCTVPTNDGSRG